MKEAIRLRYSLLRYMYTCLFKSSEFGDPTIRHPMYDWPGVKELVNNENSFMIGPAIRISANFDISEEPNKFTAPFAQGRYLEYIQYTIIEVKGSVEEIELYNGFDVPNIHIREGSILPFQDASEGSGVTKTKDLLKKELKLLVFPTKSGYAKGNVFIANGETINEKEQFFTLIHSNKAIQVIMEKGTPDDGTDVNEVIEEIRIVGTEDAEIVDFACYMTSTQEVKPLNIESVVANDGERKYIRIFGSTNTLEFDQTDTIFYGTKGKDYNYCDKGYEVNMKSSSPTRKEFSLKKATQTNTVDDELTLIIELIDSNTVQVTITDGSDRFVVPNEALNNQKFFKNQQNADTSLDDFVTVSEDGSKFSLTIHEYQNPESYYFQIGEDSLIFSDYYLSLETKVNTNQKLYGFGERVTDFFLKEGTYTSWAKDQTDPFDDGERPSKNIYGVHPVYFTRSTTGKKHHWGMFNLNANAQDTKIEYVGNNAAKISHYITGTGIFEMYFFIENEVPEEAVSKYHQIIGPTLLPPFWSMGWHQCRYGYKSTESLKAIYQKFNFHDFPLDVMWSDIDYMDKYRDFTYDKEGFYQGLPEFVTDVLHNNSRRYVPIIDGGIAIVRDGSYKVFDEGNKKGVFIKSGNKQRNGKSDSINGMGGILYGKVWPGYAAFPDFTKKSTNEWWVNTMEEFHKELAFDGLWLDMNEVSNFCKGSCIPEDEVNPEYSVKNKIVYQPGGVELDDK